MISIGTSGYSFIDWKGPFYPEGLPDKKMLSFYAEQFPTVEINTSFYRLPTPGLFDGMRKRVPSEFTFWIKIFQGLTHEEHLNKEQLRQMFESTRPLEDSRQLAGYLAQFPWSFNNSKEAWDRILQIKEAAAAIPLAVEFRHNSWNKEEVFRRLQTIGLTYCIVDEPQISDLMPPTVQVTSDIAYFRFHGKNSKMWWSGNGVERYNYNYTTNELQSWAKNIENIREKARNVFVFFNNCHVGQAARNAQTLREMLGLPLPAGRLF